MALVIDLKPHEKILIGEAVITNDKQRTRLHIAGDAPILREKDVMQEDDAQTPCERIYFLIQCMYLARKPELYFDQFYREADQIKKAAPSTALFFINITNFILKENFYKAMKQARELMAFEQELLEKASGQTPQDQTESA
ncbi:MAG: flagellar biosynthesis repressor FlbT [Pseudomonadota bacterium]|jgi:flagellar protein FlbT|nr:flagellar biosynthesis repressor FlbT [Alphaproteobacteria bacterium]MCS5597677.1 flagellar biosynthesis repressor FlbT [Alphaproteobacteria bacterium]MEC7577324.1 flagellar biosynthesis repressor FlbT [Pseudomonadota bacterium]MEC7702138.1 flagellar biosynthesis repressor FlbT [Pseudomonadota bacterium]MEE3322305.1 flagellar biosynthesis repressor FlbT [Pseudomonadota bacterium]|tara:strand:- start:5546 stop:5965 length:420 start_codon:yes stop_codon:yes gene_type:complete